LEVDNAAPGGDSAVGEIEQQEFHLVKLARNGMVYIPIPRCSPGDLVTFMSRVLNDFHTRSRAAPRYSLHVPLQAFPENKECENEIVNQCDTTSRCEAEI